MNAKSINCDLYSAHAYHHLGTYMIFINKMYDLQIKSGKFYQDQRQLGEKREFIFTFRMVTNTDTVYITSSIGNDKKYSHLNDNDGK